jgi:hypothetical protein
MAVIRSLQQACQTVNEDVEAYCADQGIQACDSHYTEFARILLDVEQVPAKVAAQVRRAYGL